MDITPQLVFVVAVLAVLIAGGIHDRRRRRRLRSGYERLIERDPLLAPTDRPCGLTAEELAGLSATPRGDRRFGLRYGVETTITATIEDQEMPLRCGAFQWWHEQRQQTTARPAQVRRRTTRRSSLRGRQRYAKRTSVVVTVQLPNVVGDDIRITPESLLGQVGLTRGGLQLESSEFNRRFRIDAADERLVLQLLDAAMQHRLAEEFAGRTVQVRGTMLAVGGAPTHMDASLPGVIGQLPAVRQDAARLVGAIPQQFWRAVAQQLPG